MAVKGIEMGLAAVLVSLLWAGVAAQSGCTSVLITMAPCLNYVTGSSTTPSSSCCSQLANVVKSRPECLCTALNGGGSSLGVTINQTLALALPGACKVETPPVSRCNASNGSPVSPAASPATSPEGAPADTSNGTPSSSTSSSGSKTVPASGESTSSGAVVKMPLQLTFLLIFIAAYVSTIATTSEFSSGFLAA